MELVREAVLATHLLGRGAYPEPRRDPTFDPSTPPFDPHALTRPRRKLLPHIYSPEELARLLAGAAKVSSRHPLRGLTLPTMVGLPASSGLRIGEVAAALDRADVDLTTGVLAIRRSKFNKDRLVPVHASTREALQRYAVQRDAAWPTPCSRAFFLQQRGGRFSSTPSSCRFCRRADGPRSDASRRGGGSRGSTSRASIGSPGGSNFYYLSAALVCVQR